MQVEENQKIGMAGEENSYFLRQLICSGVAIKKSVVKNTERESADWNEKMAKCRSSKIKA